MEEKKMLEKGDRKDWSGLKNLIIVAGHSIYVGDNFENPCNDDNWLLLSYQKGHPSELIKHIRKGVEIANKDKNSLLVFSGGQTRFEAGPRTEAQSYWLVAKNKDWWNCTGVETRATTEEFATDSLQNLLFGISRFYECTERFPGEITMVSWAHKKRRFQCHSNTILGAFNKLGLRFNFKFIGAGKQPGNADELEKTRKAEKDTLDMFCHDEWGIKGTLSDKRKERNKFRRTHGYYISCPWLEKLLK